VLVADAQLATGTRRAGRDGLSQRLEEGGGQRPAFRRPLSRIASMSRSRASRSQAPSSAMAAMMQSTVDRTVLPLSRRPRYSSAARK
jgi:hypothetical protein